MPADVEAPATRARGRYLRTSAYKAREVLGLIRGLEVEAARDVLRFCERAAAEDVLKVLNSAAANAEHTLNLPPDELYVSAAYADEGPTIKRWRPRARGRATRIRKRTSHVTIVVARLTDEQLAKRQRATEPGRRRRGVLPSRRRKGGEKEPTPAAAKGKGPPEEAAPPAVEEEEEDVEARAARDATLGREPDEGGPEEDTAAGSGDDDEEEGSS